MITILFSSKQNLIIFLLFVILLQLLLIVKIYKNKKKETQKLSQRFVQYLKPLDDQQELLFKLIEKIRSKAPHSELIKLTEKIMAKRYSRFPKKL